MVRGPAAVLGGTLAAQAYLLAAPSLPAIAARDAALVVAGLLGLAAALACCAAVVPLADHPALLVLALVGSAILAAALAAGDAGAAATAAEACSFAAAGALFAVALLTPGLAVALPLFVAAADAVAAIAGGGSGLLAGLGEAQRGDLLSLELPALGGGLPAAHLSAADGAFAGVFLAYARGNGLRPWATAAALWAALAGALVLEVLAGTELPVLTLLAAAYFAANIDRLPALLRRAAAG